MAGIVGCGVSQTQPAAIPTSSPLPTTAPPAVTSMPTSTPKMTSTPAPTPDFTSLVEKLTNLGFKEMDPSVANFYCAKGATCRNFQGVNGLIVIIDIDNGNYAIFRMMDKSVDVTPQVTTLTAILQTIGLNDAEIAWVNSHVEDALAGNTEVGNFTDFNLTENLSLSSGSLQQIMLKIEHVK